MHRSKHLFQMAAAVCGLAAIAALSGCGSSSGAINGQRIYIADTGNNEIVRSDDFAGTNWTYYLGSSPNNLVRPSSLAFDSTNQLYIVDSSNNRIVRMDNISGTNFTSFGTLGSSTGNFYHPGQIAIDASNRLYITDTGNNRVVRMDAGTGTGSIAGTNWVTLGALGSGTNQFNAPVGIALDSANHIYIADVNNNRIVRMDDMNGTNWTAFGTLGAGTNQFNTPSGVAVDSANHIYIGDSGNNRIIQMTDMTGTGWTAYGSQGPGYGQFNNPTTVQTLTQGTITYIFVADSGNSRIVRMDNITGANEI